MLHFILHRPDAIVRTGVIEPWNLSTDDPVAAARRVVAAFTNAVGPQKSGLRPSRRIGVKPIRVEKTPDGTMKMKPLSGYEFGAPAVRAMAMRNMVRRPSPGSGSPGGDMPPTLEARRQKQNVMRNSDCTAPPMDKLRRGVIGETVAGGPLFAYYDPGQAMNDALSTGSVWDMIGAKRALIGTFGIKLPGGGVF